MGTTCVVMAILELTAAVTVVDFEQCLYQYRVAQLLGYLTGSTFQVHG
jgi:hypothetical protein